MEPAESPSTLEEVLGTVVRTARLVFDAAACSIALLDADELVYRVADGAGAAAIVGRRISASAGIAGWAVTSGQAISVSELREDPRFARDVAEETGYVPTTILAAPLEAGDDSLGVIQVLDPANLGVGLPVLGGFATLAAAVAGAFGAPAPAGPALDLGALDRLGGREAELARTIAGALRAYAESGP